MWTKGAIVKKAYAELALAGYTFDLDPEEMSDALSTLDLQHAEWDSRGIVTGYAMALSPDDTDEDTPSGLPVKYVGASYLSLATRIAASKGKQLAPSTLGHAKAAFDAMVLDVVRASTPQVQYPSTTPRGAGNKPWRRTSGPFMPTPDTSPIGTASDGSLDLTGN